MHRYIHNFLKTDKLKNDLTFIVNAMWTLSGAQYISLDAIDFI